MYQNGFTPPPPPPPPSHGFQQQGYPAAPAPAAGAPAGFDAADPTKDLTNRGIKLPHGEHLCQVVSFHSRNGFKGYSVIMELVALEGPTAGARTSDVWMPLANPQYQAKEWSKIKMAMAACFGSADPAYAAKLTQKEFIACEQGALTGRLVKVYSYPASKPNKHGVVPTLYEFRPYLEHGEPVTRPVADAAPPVAAAPAAPPPPPPPAAPAVVFPPEGWFKHPGVADGYYNAAGETLSTAQLRQRLGL